MASATRIYGEKMDWLWGEMIPVPEGQLTAVSEHNWQRVLGAGTPEEEAHSFYSISEAGMSVDGVMRYWRRKGVGSVDV
jgi:hypothetical protein